MPEVRIKGSARRDLKRLPRKVVEWVFDVMRKLEEDPFSGKRLLLPANLRGLHCFRLRRGDYRLIYCYFQNPDVVYIFAVGHRDEVYKKFWRRIR